MSYAFRDRVIVITGGAGGIGSAFCRMVAPRRARLAIVDIRGDRAARLAADLPGNDHRGYGCDLTDRSEVHELLRRIESDYGRIDVLINNVGMTSSERFDERSVESIERELTVNLTSPLVLTRLAIPLLRASSDPRIISTVSLGGIFPLGETPMYTASKFGLRGAMLSIGLDLREKGILAGSVLPSATDTMMLRQEALDGGNSLQFQDPPQQPVSVARAMVRQLDRPQLETYPRRSESWLVRTVMLVPNLLPRLLPLFRTRGERGMAAYIERLRRGGAVIEVDGALRLIDDAASDSPLRQGSIT